MPSKPWYQSKTIRLNALALLIVLIDLLAQNYPALQSVLPAHLYAWIAFVLPVLNGIVRSQTFQAIHFFTPPDSGAGGKS